jgi:ElaB/YqjD/DUF883 family membrane-anchored ribosome-binding protein
MDRAKAKISNLDESFDHAVHATQEYVGQHPLKSLAVVGLAGLVIGLLISSRR